MTPMTCTGISVDIAINHDPEAIKMHKANHPSTKHLCEDVWAVDPIEACGGKKVALAWFSPDCKHFSKAKGGKPNRKSIEVCHMSCATCPNFNKSKNSKKSTSYMQRSARKFQNLKFTKM